MYPGHFQTSNMLLASLPQDELRVVQSLFTRVRLVSHQPLIDHEQPAEHAFFIEAGIVSVVAELDDGSPGVQVAMIGREGLVGALALLGASAPYACAVV